MTGELEQKAIEIINQLQHLAPQATALALKTAQINAVSNLLCGAIGLALAAATVAVWRKLYWPWKPSDDAEVEKFLLGLLLVLWGTGWLLCGIFQLFEIWNWVGLFHPELFLAHKVI